MFGDLAFMEHMLATTNPQGMLAVVMPHGVLFRGGAEQEIRRAIVEDDLFEAIIGLAPNLFYNSPMEACVLVCRARKPAERQARILFIDAVHEVLDGL